MTSQTMILMKELDKACLLMTVCGARWVANIHERMHVGWGVVEEYTHRCILACEMPK